MMKPPSAQSLRRTHLSAVWPNLRSHPWIPIVAPTKVERWAASGALLGIDLWCKRDDQTHPIYGGNKVRKLEWILGDAIAQRRSTLLTTGSWGSHHAFATAWHGAFNGFDVDVVLGPQPESSHVADMLRLTCSTASQVEFAKSYSQVSRKLAWAYARLKLADKRPYFVPPGGSSVMGMLGYVEAAYELGAQLDAGLLPEPDMIVVTLGTGGTVAGLAVGLAALGMTTPIRAVRIIDGRVSNRATLHAQTKRLVAHIRQYEKRFPDVAQVAMDRIEIDENEFGPGYGVPTASAAKAKDHVLETEGVELDLTYTAKAFASIMRESLGNRGRRILYWHTLNSASLAPLLENAPSVPSDVLSRGGLQKPVSLST